MNRIFHPAFLSGSFDRSINKKTVSWITHEGAKQLWSQIDEKGMPFVHWMNDTSSWSVAGKFRFAGGKWGDQSQYSCWWPGGSNVSVVRCNDTSKWYGWCHTTTSGSSCVVDKAVLDIGFKTRFECAKALTLYKMFIDRAVRVRRGWVPPEHTRLIFTDDMTIATSGSWLSHKTLPLYEKL